ncbi:hypothetical protein ACFX12_022274 [Malus domestica]
MVQLFKNCAYSSTPEVFDVNLQILRKKGGGLIDKFFEDLTKENYSDTFFLGARYGEMWSNVAESFNSWIRKERLLPIFQLVESIRVKLMVMNAERRIAAEKWNSYLCPEMENQLDKLLRVGRHWHINRSIAAIMHNNGNPYDYIEDYFTTDYYKSSYSFPIESIPDIYQSPICFIFFPFFAFS